EVREIGAHVGQDLDIKRQKAELLVERQLEPGDVVAALSVGHKGVGALGRPFDRAAELLRRPQNKGVLRIEKKLHAEAAANVRGHDAYAVFGDLENALG